MARGRLTCVLSLGLLVQGILLYRAHHPVERSLVGDETYYQAKALELAAGKPGVEIFVFPPLYPRLLATVYGIFGPHRIAVEILQGALFMCTGVAFRALLLEAGIGALASDAALFLFLSDLGTASFALYLWPETVGLFLALLSLQVVARDPRVAKWRAVVAGSLCGLAVCTKLLLGPFLPVLAGFVGLRGAGLSDRDRAIRAALFAAGAITIVSPVVIANGLHHGYWGISNSGPFNVWVGLNDPPSRTDYDSVVVPEGAAYLASSADPAERNRIVWARVVDKVNKEGFLPIVIGQLGKQYGRLFDRESFFTDQLPGGRWRRGEPRSPRDFAWRLWAYAGYAAILILAGLGLALADWRGRLRVLALPALFLAYNLGLFLFLHVKTRYRFAFVPALLFFAAIAVERLHDAWSGSLEAARTLRWATGLGLAALWITLAFGTGCPGR